MQDTLDSTVYRIAKVCHEVNRAYCECIGDYSQMPWKEAPEWQRKSAYQGAQFRIQHPEASAQDIHDEWLRYKLMDGWKYGEHKNPALKEHPCLVPYDDLPAFQKTKDHLFAAVISAMIPVLTK